MPLPWLQATGCPDPTLLGSRCPRNRVPGQLCIPRGSGVSQAEAAARSPLPGETHPDKWAVPGLGTRCLPSDPGRWG